MCGLNQATWILESNADLVRIKTANCAMHIVHIQCILYTLMYRLYTVYTLYHAAFFLVMS